MAHYSAALLIALLSTSIIPLVQAESMKEAPNILIVLGSARDHSVSKKLARVLESLLGDVSHEVVDLKSLPLFDPEKPIQDSAVDAWQKKFEHASAVIFLAPNYNGGYTGVLKNGIDALGSAAAGKNVALIAYSGGYAAAEPVDALMPTLEKLHMNIINQPVVIPMADSAFDGKGTMKNAELQKAIDELVNDILKSLKE